MGSTDGKVAVVSGASSGSGVGITRRFVQEGATVVMLARARPCLEEVAGEFGSSAFRSRPTSGTPTACGPPSRRSCVSFGTGRRVSQPRRRLPALRRGAPGRRRHPPADGDQLLRPRLHASWAAMPLLRAAGGGDIVNTSSESTLHPFPMLSLYVASKAGTGGVRQGVGPGGARRRHPGHDGRARDGGGRGRRRHGLRVGPRAHCRLPTPSGPNGVSWARYWVATTDRVSTTSATCTSSSSPAPEQRLDTVHVRSF